MAGTLQTPELGKKGNTEHPKVDTAVETLNGLLNSENKIARAGMEAAAKPLAWYTPKIIATEESRTNTAFGKLATADEIKEIVVPEGGLLVVVATAQVKCSVESAGMIGLFVGSAEIATTQVAAIKTAFRRARTDANAFQCNAEEATVTTGRVLGSIQVGELAASTYTVSLQYKASSGSITAKERTLRACVLGF